jgi:hypothetical protein
MSLSSATVKGECTRVDGGPENNSLPVAGGSTETAEWGEVAPCVSDGVAD